MATAIPISRYFAHRTATGTFFAARTIRCRPSISEYRPTVRSRPHTHRNNKDVILVIQKLRRAIGGVFCCASVSYKTFLCSGVRDNRFVREFVDQGDRPMNAIDLLKADHDRIEELFERFKENEEDSHATLFKQIRNELDTHTHIEETIFYPAALKRGKADLKKIV